MIIRGAAIHRDGHGKCGLLVTQIFLRSLAGLATPPSAFCQHESDRHLPEQSYTNQCSAQALLRRAIFSCRARE